MTPVVMAGALWLMTHSPYALAFAALGPLGAVISLFDGRRNAGRERQAALAERAVELERLGERIAAIHEDERRALARRAPGAAAALAAAAGSALWKGDDACVRLGIGTVPSRLTISGDPLNSDELALQRHAALLNEAPVIAEAVVGIAVCGPPLFARACLRGLIVQLYAALPPERLGSPELTDREPDGAGEWHWVTRLPHATAAAARTAGRQVLAPRFGVFSDPSRVPPGFRIVVSVTSPVLATVERYGTSVSATGPGGEHTALALAGAVAAQSQTCVVPELVPRADAEAFADALAARAKALGVGPDAAALPSRVAFADLPPGPRVGLGASVGRDAGGIAQLDLVNDGPHAIVAGVTGSGKSELLVTWVAGMVSGRSSDDLVVLLIDFKGGTAFQPLAVLPHVVGVITDLRHGEAARALGSLAAELRTREAELARLGVRDVADSELPRLVIVVDEFAAMIDAFSDFGPLFTDIAARGRALGVHLVLATQRPAGVMRDALVANCPLRLSLRVQSDADSRWVVGTDAASRLSSATPGRCIIAVDGMSTEVQIACTTGSDLAALAQNAPPAAPPRRPWLDPLPPVLTRAALPEGASPQVVAVADRPDEQRRTMVQFATSDLPLAVLGAARSGKTSVLHTLVGAAGFEALVVSADREYAWDAVAAARERCDEPQSDPRPLLLAVDDADAVCARLGDAYAAEWCESLARVMRDGPAAGVHTVMAAQRQTGPLREVLGLARETVLLRQASKQEHVLAGAPGELWDEALPPGAGVWRGRRVQFLAPTPRLETSGGSRVHASGEPAVIVPLVPARGSVTLVVARAPARLAARARRAGLPAAALVDLGAVADGGFAPFDIVSVEALLARPALPTGLLIIGDPEAWLGRWSLCAALKAKHPLVFVGCDAADVRSLTRSRALPPPLAPGPGTGWVVRPDGRVRRCHLDAA